MKLSRSDKIRLDLYGNEYTGIEILLEVKKIPTELLCGLGDVYWEAESTK